MDSVLYGSMDFSGKAYFGGLVVERVWPPLEVAILGPASLRYKETGTYTAAVSQGSGDYRYHWYRQYDGSNAWQALGNVEESQWCPMLNKGFTLRVDVYDAVTGEEGSATKHVGYEGDGGEERTKPVR